MELEPIVHEEGTRKSQKEVTSKELKILNGTLKKLDRQLEGRDSGFNSDLEKTEEQLKNIPRQLEEASGGLKSIINLLEKGSDSSGD